MPERTERLAEHPVAIASDHAGYGLKSDLIRLFSGRVAWLDLGTHSDESVDYPDYGYAVGRAIVEGRASRGVVICGSGVGISIAANRFPGVRAALCVDSTTARLARLHNDANVLALGARIVGIAVATDCLEVFLATEFEGGRHKRRVEKLRVTS
ncbi:MAG: ribose 5-phosphate isomerase B [Rhodospirillales bacterium]|nr:ribose 5-phosphate isomerase B [Rhodospirillales bacterium]